MPTTGQDVGTTWGGRILKVDHAGEHGAIAIYSGQIAMARFTAPDLCGTLIGFREHERRHREIFGAELAHRRLRRCRSYVLCGLGGWVLGLVTGLFGRAAIATTTVTVERVVLGHLEAQLRDLSVDDPRAATCVAAILDDERAHHDHFFHEYAPTSRRSRFLSLIVAASTEIVIRLGMRL